MSQLSENIFDERGGLRTDLENVTVPPERRPVFEALVNAVRAAELAEADVIAKADAEAAAVKAQTNAAAAMPKWTALDEWRAMKGSR
jgi:hypothetical protein